MTSTAAAAKLSAKAISVDLSVARRGRSRRAGRSPPPDPAMPMATPVEPIRHGRPKLSVTTTPIGPAPTASNRRRNSRAERSGSSGSKQDLVVALHRRGKVGMVYPAVGHDMAESVLDDTDIAARPHDLMRFPANRFRSAARPWRSFPASREPRPRLNRIARSRCRPSALDTIFCANTTISPVCKADRVRRQRRRDQRGEVVTGPDPGNGTGTSR